MRRAALFALLFLGSGCLDGFRTLVTVVTYDPFGQSFWVERRLQDVTPAFFGCDQAPEACVAAVQRVLDLSPPELAVSPADTLVLRLLDSGPVDPVVALERVGDRVDIVVRYGAPLGGRAAEDTLVRAEFDASHKGRGVYRLVVDSAASVLPPEGRHRIRRVAQAGTDGLEWHVWWELPGSTRDVTTTLPVSDQGTGLLVAWPELRNRLPWSDGAQPGPRPAAAVAESPQSHAPGLRVVAHDPRINGAADSARLAESASALLPAIETCWEGQAALQPGLEGYAFLFARVDSHGHVASTSVYGTLAAPSLYACLERAFHAWTPPGVLNVDVEFPFALSSKAPR